MSKSIFAARIAIFVAVVATGIAVSATKPAARQEGEKDKSSAKKTAEAKKASAPKVSRVTVEVKSAGQPVAHANVFLDLDGADLHRDSSTNSDGIARFEGVPQGKINLQVEADGYKLYTLDGTAVTQPEVTIPVEMVKQ